MQTILVTGANTGIGLALCKQLCKDHGARVFLGSRNTAKGAAAVEEVKKHAGPDAQVEALEIDVGNDDSVAAAAASLANRGVRLTAIVNNAGTGLGHDGVSPETVMDVNLLGPKRVVDAFRSLLDPTTKGCCARIVNVGSGLGCGYVAKQPLDRQKRLCNPGITWEEIRADLDRGVTPEDPAHGDAAHYGLSKALLTAYTMLLAKSLASSGVAAYCLSPGYIDTAMTAGWPGGKPPEEGTVSIRHCLFGAGMDESGWFFGSDAERSPIHCVRNPGEPVFDGVIDWESVEQKLANSN